MSALKTLTRASVDQAEPLEFPNRPKPPASALVTVQFQGVPVQLDLFALDKDTLAQVEKRITRLLEREGRSRPATTRRVTRAVRFTAGSSEGRTNGASIFAALRTGTNIASIQR